MPPKIRSLHVIFSLDNKLGGAVHAVLGVATYLNAAGHTAEVVASYLPTDDTAYLQTTFPNVPCHFLPRTFPRRFYFAAGLGTWMRENASRFDVVEIHGVWLGTSYAAWKACVGLNKPFVVRPHGSLDPFDLQKRALLKSLLGPCVIGPLLNEACGAMLTAQLEADRLVGYGSNPRKFVVPLPIASGMTTPGKARVIFRKKHRIPDDAMVVLFFSRIDYKKGLEFLIPALAKLKTRHESLVFLLVGSGQAMYVESIQSLLEAYGALPWTIQTGFLSGEDKQSALAASDVFALPSLNENFGIVIVEAMRAGLPVVISDEVYINQEIASAGAGLVCQPTIDSCRRALQAILSMTLEHRLAMGERARICAQNSFSPEAATQKLLDLYQAVTELGNSASVGSASASTVIKESHLVV